MKNCPYCAEEIQDEAIKCRYCHEFLEKEIESKPIEDKWRCPKCDREVLLNKDYCVCGHYKFSKIESEKKFEKSKKTNWYPVYFIFFTPLFSTFYLILTWLMIQITEAVFLEPGGKLEGVYQSLHGIFIGFFLFYSSNKSKSDFVMASVTFPGGALFFFHHHFYTMVR